MLYLIGVAALANINGNELDTLFSTVVYSNSGCADEYQTFEIFGSNQVQLAVGSAIYDFDTRTPAGGPQTLTNLYNSVMGVTGAGTIDPSHFVLRHKYTWTVGADSIELDHSICNAVGGDCMELGVYTLPHASFADGTCIQESYDGGVPELGTDRNIYQKLYGFATFVQTIGLGGGPLALVDDTFQHQVDLWLAKDANCSHLCDNGLCNTSDASAHGCIPEIGCEYTFNEHGVGDCDPAVHEFYGDISIWDTSQVTTMGGGVQR